MFLNICSKCNSLFNTQEELYWHLRMHKEGLIETKLYDEHNNGDLADGCLEKNHPNCNHGGTLGEIEGRHV